MSAGHYFVWHIRVLSDKDNVSVLLELLRELRSSDSVHTHRSPAMYSLRAAQPGMMVPPSNAQRRLASVSPSLDKGFLDIRGVLAEAGRKSRRVVGGADAGNTGGSECRHRWTKPTKRVAMPHLFSVVTPSRWTSGISSVTWQMSQKH